MPSRHPRATARARGRYGTAYAIGWDGSGHEDPVVDEPLGDLLALRVEAAVLEVLGELELDVGLAVAVLLDADDRPAAEALDVAEVVDEVLARDDIDLVVDDEDDVGLEGQRRRAAQVVRAHPVSRGE